MHLERMYSCTDTSDMSLASGLYVSRAVGPRIKFPERKQGDDMGQGLEYASESIDEVCSKTHPRE